MDFFALPDIQAKLTAAGRVYDRYQSENETAQLMADLVKHTIDSIIKNASLYDENCTYTIEKHGKDFISRLPRDENQISNSSFDIIFLLTHRLLCELDFHTNIDTTSTIGAFFDHINSNTEKLPENIKHQINNNRYALPSDFIKEMLKSETGKSILEFRNNLKKFDELQKKSHQEISDYIKKIEQLKTTLQSHEQAFNFVGLHDGFKNLHKKKTEDKNISFWGMMAIFSTMLLTLLMEIISIQSKPITEPINISHTVLMGIPLVAIEMLLIYLFRIVLANYQSIKKQILQLELRMTLCQFIQSYTNYAKEMKTADPTSLEKFENLIFSGIVMDDQQLPSTFDGIEQISKMISALKSGPK